METYDISQNEPYVMQLQKKLRTLSRRIDDPMLSVGADGIYDNRTKEAVKHFQQLYGLDITGIVDFLTWETIDREYRYYAELFGKSRSLAPFPDHENFSLGQGDRSDLVLIIQIILNELRIFYDTYGFIPQNGRFSTATENAVREFQRIGGLDVTGRVDRLTWNRLSEEYNVAVRKNE